jgi:hypothetical protein
MYIIFRNNLGKVDAVNKILTGEMVSFDDPNLLAWLAQNPEFTLDDQPVNPLSLQELKDAKKLEVITEAYLKQQSLVSDFAPPEQATWARKVDECKKLLAGEKLDNLPMIKAESIALADSTDELVVTAYANNLANKIVTKSEQLYIASAQIAGNRARLCATIDSIKDIKELM